MPWDMFLYVYHWLQSWGRILFPPRKGETSNRRHRWLYSVFGSHLEIQAELVAPKKMCFFPTGIFETIWTKMTSKMTSMIFGFQVLLEISWNFLLFTGISLGGIPGYPKNICFYWWAMCLVALFTGRLTQQLEPVQPCSKDVSREFSELRDL